MYKILSQKYIRRWEVAWILSQDKEQLWPQLCNLNKPESGGVTSQISKWFLMWQRAILHVLSFINVSPFVSILLLQNIVTKQNQI